MVHAAAETQEEVLRVSMDAKARVKVGLFSRGGTSRNPPAALDHDFHPEIQVTPWGIFLPELDELTFYITPSKVTADFIVDSLEAWWDVNQDRFPKVTTLLINLDNGPENQSRRTQFLYRLVEFAKTHTVNIQLAYYPPYHSKYNPIERCWGVLEKYWNGDLLDTVEAVLGFARNMTWKGEHPIVHYVTTIYETGKKLTQKAMKAVEQQVQRLASLEKWFVYIPHDGR